MALTVKAHMVWDIALGTEEGLKDGCLTVDAEKLCSFLKEETSITAASLDIVKPGEKTRIIHILDAITPVCDLEGGNCFPGFIGTPETSGSGTICELRGTYLLTTSTFPSEDAILRTREAIVDMWGRGQSYSPYASSLNFILTLETDPKAEKRNADAAVRMAGLKAAVYLAKLAAECECDVEEIVDRPEEVEGLPGGRSVEGILPTLITRQELVSGAVVTDEYFYGGQRQPTAMYQHNPIVEELLRRHGTELNFKGIIVCRGYNNTNVDKRRAAAYCANLASILGAKGAVMHPESGGNSHVDCMLTAQACEKAGVSTVIIAAEMGDVESRDVSLIDYVPEATAIVSAGNREALVSLETAEKIIGGQTLLERTEPASAQQDVPMNFYFCATSQVGAWKISMDAM